MDQAIPGAFRTGYERLAAWADLVDSINVFPVADGDTGKNLLLSLAPMLGLSDENPGDVIHRLLVSARGTSGNIVSRFLSAFVRVRSRDDLAPMALQGREQAWQAVEDPKPGTVLSVFDALCEALQQHAVCRDSSWTRKVIGHLEKTVSSTTDQLPQLRAAGVVDSGALGMFIFFDGFFVSLSGGDMGFCPIAEVFGDKIEVGAGFRPEAGKGYCVDFVLRSDGAGGAVAASVRSLGEATVAFSDGDYVKAHVHTDDRELLRGRIENLGEVVQWSWDDLAEETARPRAFHGEAAIHVVTDAAGSVSRDDAARLGMTVLDSYVNYGDLSVPESYVVPEDLYAAMRGGARAYTSQASVFERHQHYEKLIALYPRALYLCVGSVYTGNYQVAMSWKQTNDASNRLVVLDTGSACGRLGLVAIVSARHSLRVREGDEVIRYAKRAMTRCSEFIFLDKLQYLAAGGRISRPRSFLGDLLRIKPVVTPTPEGAKKVAALRTRGEQLDFLLKRVEQGVHRDAPATFLLEYTDTRPFVEETVLPELRRRWPASEFLVRPISITSGVHMGPGTWAVAFLPGEV